MTFNLIDSWGDKYYIGLTGIEVYDTNMQKIHISSKNISANPRDLNSTPGFEGDPRVLENLLDPENITLNEKKMWLIQFMKGKDHLISIKFPTEVKISGLETKNH